jgi:hypothetical protein
MRVREKIRAADTTAPRARRQHRSLQLAKCELGARYANRRFCGRLRIDWQNAVADGHSWRWCVRHKKFRGRSRNAFEKRSGADDIIQRGHSQPWRNQDLRGPSLPGEEESCEAKLRRAPRVFGDAGTGIGHARVVGNGEELNLGLRGIERRRQTGAGAGRDAERGAAELVDEVEFLGDVRIPGSATSVRRRWDPVD